MKLSLLMALGFFLVTQSAFATRARLQALGQNKNGSLFISDDRNIFLNPAHVTTVQNKINLEAGKTDQSATSATNPKAEGGLVYRMNDFSIAAQLGRVGDATARISSQTSLSGTTFYDPQNSVELILGGGGKGLAWGGSLHYANSESEIGATTDYPDSKAKVLTARGGVVTDKFQAYGSWDVNHESSTRTSAISQREFDGNLSLEAGGSYNMSETAKLGGYILNTGNDFNDGGTSKGDYKLMKVNGTYFHNFKKEEGLMIFGMAGLTYSKGVSDYEAAGQKDDESISWALPIGLGLESQLTSWFAIRGSVTQTVLVDKTERKNTASNSMKIGEDDTVVTLGSSFNYKDFVLDATLAGSGGTGTAQIDGNTLMANVGLTYAF